jgi:gluconolactonase
VKLTLILLAAGASALGLAYHAKAGHVAASPGEASAAKVEKMGKGKEIEKIVPVGATLEKIASGFTWTEGPVWVHKGYLLFADIPANTIHKWTPGTDKPEVFIKPSGWLDPTPFGGKEPGSNGMTMDTQGRLTVAGHARRNVWRLETMDPHGQITVLADSYHGKKLNSPNDLVYKSDGTLYFTDPPYGLASQQDYDPQKELKVNGVYRLPGARQQAPGAPPANDKLQLLISDLPRPNGLAFSPDEKYLYVNCSDPKLKIWKRYPVTPDGSLGEGKLIYDATSDPRDGAPDGMKVDEKGNIYSTGPGGIWIFSPELKHIGTIDVPERTGNLAWGDEDGKTLYIMASDMVYRIKLNIAGLRP